MKTWLDTRGRIFWYDQYALNEQETAFARYDPVRIADEIAGTGADLVAVYAANQFGIAYYPSKIWPMHPRLKGRDYFGRVSRALRKRGKKIIAYVNWLDSKHAEENVIPIKCQAPSRYWEQPLAKWAPPSRPNGRVQALPGGGWRQICLNSPHREQVVAIVREIVERYHPDAFHVDMVVNQVCACRFCRPTLEKICGTKKVSAEILARHWPAYVDWRCERSASLIAEISVILRKCGIVAVHNGMSPLYTPAVTGISEQWLQSLDVYLSECFDAFRSPMTDLNSTSITARWQHAVGKPAWILRTSTPPHHAHWPISPAQWQVHAAACKANGCKVFGPCGIGAYPDTTSSKAALANIRRAFDCFMEDADLDPDAAPASKIALIFSWATRRYCRPQIDEHGDVAADWNGEFIGWARFLIEDHLPFDIQIAENITASSQLAKYDLVILPDVANVSDAFCAVMGEYVCRGGKLLATAETSLQNERGGRRDDFALRETLGVSLRGAINGCFAIERPQEPEPAAGAFQQVVPSGKVVARCVTVDPAGSVAGPQGLDPLPMEVADWPVIVANQFGRGQSNYVAFDIGRFYLRCGDEHIRMLMAERVVALLATRQIVVEAPRTVEVTVWEQKIPQRTIVHLANRTVAAAAAADTRHVSEIIPVHQIELRLKKPYPKVAVAARHAEIKWRAKGNQLAISISKVDAYAAVMIESATKPGDKKQRAKKGNTWRLKAFDQEKSEQPLSYRWNRRS